MADHELPDHAHSCLSTVDAAEVVHHGGWSNQRFWTWETGVVISVSAVIDANELHGVLEELKSRQLACGGWAAMTKSMQPALEPSCLALLSLRSEADCHCRAAQEFILRVQNPNGSWPVVIGDDIDGSWLTSLAAIALHDCVPAIPATLRAFHWLLRCAGKESNWFWKWKFLTMDRHVCFDPNKYGWPWFPDSLSWVVPTSFAILALNQIPCDCGDFGDAGARVRLGLEMLIDRACPGGGWNAGNGIVYGAPLAPHIDDTAVALLALARGNQHRLVQEGVLWLERVVQNIPSPLSLAWGILALAAHGRPVTPLLSRLRSLPDIAAVRDTSTLAAMALALDCKTSLLAFGVAV